MLRQKSMDSSHVTIHVTIERLQNDLEDIQYKINHLSRFYSCHQIRTWKSARRLLKKKIKYLRGITRRCNSQAGS